MLKNNDPLFPSHGRGHRFNPYSAHHFPQDNQHQSEQSGADQHQDATSSRGLGVEGVRAMFTGLDALAGRRPALSDLIWVVKAQIRMAALQPDNPVAREVLAVTVARLQAELR